MTSPSDIPDEAVEAAAVAWTRLMCGCYDPEDVPHLHDELRKILEAAAPYMMAESWELGAVEAWSRSTPEVNGSAYQWRHEGEPANPYR